MLWACIHLPQLPLEVLQHQVTDAPLVIEESQSNRRYVAYANRRALACGIQIGSSIPTAHSLIQGLTVKPRHLALEQQALEHIATLAYGFTPTLSVQKPNQVLLELESCLRLFKGFENFNHKLCSALSETPFQSYIAYYKTAAGALLLAKAHPQSNICGHRFTDQDLQQCPLHYLPANQDTLQRLQSMGFQQVGELMALPTDALGKRFGKPFIHYMNCLCGKESLAIDPFKLPPRFDRRIDFVEELTHHEALLFPIKRLSHYLQHYLMARQLYVRAIVLTLLERSQQQQSLVIQLSHPHYAAGHLLSLIQHQLNKLQLTQPVIGVRLQAEWFAPMEAENHDLFCHHQTSHKDRYQLVDTLRARLGKGCVHGLAVAEDHRPEMAWQMTIPGDGKTVAYPADQRPLWLLNKPLPLNNKKGVPLYTNALLQLLKGPERIETGWWDHQPIQRDYYIAIHPNGSLLWLFKDLQRRDQWFLHGIFS